MKKYNLCVLTAFLAFTSCKENSESTFPKQALIDCGTVDVGKTIPEIGMTLVSDIVIIAASADPVKAFTNLVLTYGTNAVACAMRVAADTLTAHPPLVASFAPTSSQSTAVQAAAVSKFIQTKGWQYK